MKPTSKYYGTTYKGFYLHIVDVKNEQDLNRAQGYKYLVRCESYAHTAFYTKKGLKKWLSERGLTIGKRSGYRSVNLKGEYTRNLMLDQEEFNQMYRSGEYKEIKVMDNADYTLGLVKDSNVYLLNCNIKTRTVFPYTWE